VLELLRRGLSTAEIAERLVVSSVTVRTHVAALLRKLDVPNREALRELDEAEHPPRKPLEASERSRVKAVTSCDHRLVYDDEMSSAELREKIHRQHVLAGRLHNYAGQWVAVRGSDVVADDETLDGLRDKVAGKDVDRIFRVPKRKARLIL
jgi:predicted DNA-binding transcriptional regulator